MNQEEARRLADQVLNQSRSPETLRQYERMVRRIRESGYAGPWEYAHARGLSRRTYYAYRAAYLWDQANPVRDLLRMLDQEHKRGNKITAAGLRHELAKEAEPLLEADPDRTHHHSPEAYPGYQEPENRNKASVRRRLQGLRRDWRERVVENLPLAYQLPVGAMILGGMRPAEIAAGGTWVRTHADGRIEFLIMGAKVKKDAGQPWRRIVVLPNEEGFGNLFMQALRHVGIGEWCQIALGGTTDAFRSAFRRTTKKVLGRELPPYALRHQFSADLKKEGLDGDEISAALGHAAGHTRRHYGHSGQGRGGIEAVVEVEAAREVRDSNPGPGSKDPTLMSKSGQEPG